MLFFHFFSVVWGSWARVNWRIWMEAVSFSFSFFFFYFSSLRYVCLSFLFNVFDSPQNR